MKTTTRITIPGDGAEMLAYLARWAVVRRRRASMEAWSGIDRCVAPPLDYRTLPPITDQSIRDAAARLLRRHQVFDGGWLRDCYCADGKHGR